MGCSRRLLLIAFACFLSPVVLCAADDSDPEAVLKEKGLRRLSTHFALPEEAEFGKGIRELGAMKKKVLDAQRAQALCENRVAQKQKLMLTYLQQRRVLRAQLENARSVSAHNRLITAINELADRLALMEAAGEEEKALKAAQGRTSEATEQYVEVVLRSRKLCDQIQEKYKDLAADKTVADAIEQYNQASGKTLKLGPSSGLLSNDRRLKALEDTVLSGSIPLRGGEDGDLWHVSVMFGGEHVKELALDTGASLISLPWQMAEDIGLTPDSDAPVLHLELADGRIIEARQVFAESVRVGKFTVENVECAVMPKNLPKPAAMLGLSFLEHFTYKIDTANGKLIMSKIETAGSGPKKRP